MIDFILAGFGLVAFGLGFLLGFCFREAVGWLLSKLP